MSGVRRAGHAPTADGGSITWSVADGHGGRRWRTIARDRAGRLTGALLLELDPAGRLSKVELAGPAGLLSLHPEGDLLHGNVVTDAGVRHLRLAWSAQHVLLIDGSPVTDAAAATVAAGGVGEKAVVPAVSVSDTLDAVATEVALTRRADGTVVIDSGGVTRIVELDERAIAAVIRGGGDWPLEID
jgi:hypothetical protein